MMDLSHLFNIQGCLGTYRDLESARSWFIRAKRELHNDEFIHLVHSIHRWLLDEVPDQQLLEQVTQMLSEFDPSGDPDRHAEIESTAQRRLDERRAKFEYEQERARQEVEGLLAQKEFDRIRNIHLQKEREAQQERDRINALRQAKAESERILQQQIFQEIKAKRDAESDQIDQRLRIDFLNADKFYQEMHSELISIEEFEAQKSDFVASWLNERHIGGKRGNIPIPDKEQLSVIATLHKNVQVVARAGSGKTATLVNRAFFLQKHCGVSPIQMMLLAFNKKAAEEIEERLSKLLDERPPFVMTFHALAHALVHPEENLIHDSSDGKNQVLSRFVQSVIDVRLREPVFFERIRKVMVAHYNEDWDRIQSGGYHLSKEEMLEYRRSLQRETLRGEFVKSFGEKVIANFLFEHQIPYMYEPSERGRLKNYHPDFLIKRPDGTGVAIEYFGMAGDPDYDEMSDEKIRYWRDKPGWTLIGCEPSDFANGGVDGFVNQLRTELGQAGFFCDRMTEEEIWHQIRKRAVDRFSAATRSFIARCRKSELTPEDLLQQIAAHRTKWQVEADFLDIMVDLYDDYLKCLEAEGKEDFDGLLRRATLALSAGQTEFSRFMKKQNGDLANLRFLLIDEYQDFSKLFHSMVEAIRYSNPQLQLFCVGDDWQAINGFAGSDLSYYENFPSYFQDSEQLHISTNYRSATGIVAVGNSVMAGRGAPAAAHSTVEGHVWMVTPADFLQSPNERTRHGDDNITPMVLRLTAWALAQDKDIVVLCRTQSPPGFVNYKAHQGADSPSLATGIERFRALIRSYFPEHQRPKIKVSTAHGFKGLQGSVVVILDAVAGCYPLIHQDWIFLRLFGESVQTITDEARRLFYVALTRAVDTLVIFTENGKKSPFLEDIEREFTLHPIAWSTFPPVSAKSDRLKVVVGNQPFRGSKPTVDIKDFLKQEGYSYSKDGWMKGFSQEGFSFDALTTSPWSGRADGLLVRVLDEQDRLISSYQVDSGVWTELRLA